MPKNIIAPSIRNTVPNTPPLNEMNILRSPIPNIKMKIPALNSIENRQSLLDMKLM